MDFVKEFSDDKENEEDGGALEYLGIIGNALVLVLRVQVLVLV